MRLCRPGHPAQSKESKIHAVMATPGRLVELRCPRCGGVHWEIDNDHRGMAFLRKRELLYPEREYRCPRCQISGTGYEVVRKGPSEFFLQPHPVYPMTQSDFDYWLTVLKENMPEHPKLKDAYRNWYPGAGRPS